MEKLSDIGNFLFLKLNVMQKKKILNMILNELETLMIAIGFVEDLKHTYSHYVSTGRFCYQLQRQEIVH